MKAIEQYVYVTLILQANKIKLQVLMSRSPFFPLLVSAFLSRATVTGVRCHGDHYHAIEVVWYPSTVCYGLTLGFKTGNHKLPVLGAARDRV